jgi:hypothetical protein
LPTPPSLPPSLSPSFSLSPFPTCLRLTRRIFLSYYNFSSTIMWLGWATSI